MSTQDNTEDLKQLVKNVLLDMIKNNPDMVSTLSNTNKRERKKAKRESKLPKKASKTVNLTEEVSSKKTVVEGVNKHKDRFGAVSVKGSKPTLPFGNATNKEIEKLNKALLNPDKDRRPAYKEILVKCTECGSNFDYKKSYPIGQVEDTGVKLCPKCQSSRR